MSPRVLLVEDNPSVTEVVTSYLSEDGFEVHQASTGAGGLELLKTVAPDVLILDIRLPDVDGLTICREVRKSRDLPILILSGRNDDIDKIVGLEMGADDYLTKPFNPKEMVARVRALWRRASRLGLPQPTHDVISKRGLNINLSAHRVDFEGAEVALTPIEFSLLKSLAERAGTVLSRQQLLDTVWGAEYAANDRTVDTHIRDLRTKLREVTPAAFITSVRGLGYRFEI